MENAIQQDYSKLEKDLIESTRVDKENQIHVIRELMIRMAEVQRQKVIFTTYPACNSEI